MSKEQYEMVKETLGLSDREMESIVEALTDGKEVSR